MQTIEELKKFFIKDRFVASCGIEIAEVGDNYAVCRAEIFESHYNAGDAVQGGMLFTIADFAFAVLANKNHPITVTQSSAIQFLAPCVNTRFITARAQEISCNKRNCVTEVIVKDDKNNIVCIAQIGGFIKEQSAK